MDPGICVANVHEHSICQLKMNRNMNYILNIYSRFIGWMEILVKLKLRRKNLARNPDNNNHYQSDSCKSNPFTRRKQTTLQPYLVKSNAPNHKRNTNI